MKERIGKYHKLWKMRINGCDYYFIGSIKNGGFKWVFRNPEQAVDMFEKVEAHAEKYGELFPTV